MANTNKISLRDTETECIDDCYNTNNNNNNNHSHNNNNNNRYNTCSINALEKESICAKRNHSHQSQRRSLIDWQNSSSIIFPNSVRKSSDLDSVISYSRNSNVCQINVDSTRMEKPIAPIERIKPIESIKQSTSDDNEKMIVCRKYSEPNTDSINVLELDNYLKSRVKEKKYKKAKVPDGGWGWVVVVASLVISMVADGVSFSFGLLYIEFLHEFDSSKSKTAWIGSLFMAVPLLSGPIMSALVDRYGCRNMTILGGLISGLGFVLSSFSNSIEVMYLTFGVIAGLGLGLCYVTAVVSIAYWFDKKRTLAVGLGACGTGIGTFLYAPMTTYFIKEYGWRGTCLLLAGTFFNLIVSGTVMRDPEWWILEQHKHDQSVLKKSHARSDIIESERILMNNFPDSEQLERLFQSDHASEYFLQSQKVPTEAINSVTRQTCFKSVIDLPTFMKRSEKVPLEVLISLLRNPKLYTVVLENYPSLVSYGKPFDKQLQDSMGEIHNKNGITMPTRLKRATESKTIVKRAKDSPQSSIHVSRKLPCVRRMSKKELEEANPLLRKEVTHMAALAERTKSISKRYVDESQAIVGRTSDSLPWLRRQFNTSTYCFKDVKIYRNSIMYHSAILNLNKYKLRASSCPDIYRDSMSMLPEGKEQKWYGELVDLLKGVLDFSMFLELHFLLLSLSSTLLFTWFIVPYFYLAEHLVRNGYTESDAANLLSIIGITNTLGMIALGWAGDQPWMNVSKTYTWCLIACGVATIMMSVFTHHYVFLIISSAAFGLFFASNFSFTPVILVQLIPLERFTTAYGLSLLCQGIGNLLGPPLAGWLFDVTGSWELSFLMAGSWIIFSGALVGIIPYTKNRKICGSGLVEMERTNNNNNCLA